MNSTSAANSASRIVVAAPRVTPHIDVAGTVRIDSMAHVVRAAHAAQAEYVAEVFVRAGERLIAAIRRVVRPSTSLPLPSGRTEEKFTGFVRSH